jgi:hypothetical protein
MIRKAPVSKRFEFVRSMTQNTIWANIHHWQGNHPEASEQEVLVSFVSFSYGPALAELMQAALKMRKQQQMQPADLIAAMTPAIEVLDQLAIPSYLAGSVASSLYGMQQVPQDIDLVADLHACQVESLVLLLQQKYVFEKSAIQAAVVQRTSFPLIHVDSLLKVDVILPKSCPFDERMQQLVELHSLDEAYVPFRVASPYEMISFKLYRYYQDEQSRTDGMVNDAEWNDIVGMLKVQGTDLNLALLERWAETLHMTDAFNRALVDAGLRDE